MIRDDVRAAARSAAAWAAVGLLAALTLLGAAVAMIRLVVRRG